MVRVLQPILALMLATSLVIPRATLPCCCSAISSPAVAVSATEAGRCGSCCGAAAAPTAKEAPAHDGQRDPQDRPAPANCPSPCCSKHMSPPQASIATVDVPVQPLTVAAELPPHSVTLDTLFRPPRS